MMIRSFLKATAFGLSAASLMILAGCADVSRHDVTAAREKAMEEQQEANEARRDAQDKIVEQEQRTDEVRREAFRPTYDEQGTEAIRTEEERTEEVRRETAEEVNEEQQEANEAATEAAKTEARFEAQKARDSYVKEAELQLIKADEQIAVMKEQAANLEGAEKDASDTKMNLIDERRETAQEAIDDVKSAEVEDWELARDDVERALKDLTQALAAN
jgi:hypothetical protein